MKMRLLLCAAIALLLISSCAMGSVPRQPGQDWWLDYQSMVGQPGQINWLGWTNQNVGAGALYFKAEHWTPMSQPQQLLWSGYKWMFCMDRNWLLQSGDWYQQLVGQAPGTNNLPPLSYNSDQWSRKVWLMHRYSMGVLTDADKACGLQLAIWEVITDQTLDLGTGNFQVVSGFTPTAIGYANSYLSTVQLSSAAQLAADVCYVDGQNLNEVIPEIPAAVLAPLGLAALGLIRRRFAR